VEEEVRDFVWQRPAHLPP